MHIRPRVNYPLFLSDFNKIDFSLKVWNNTYQVSNFMKIRPVGAELFYADGRTDGRTDMKKLKSVIAILHTRLKI
jgi:hypothetical protein